MIHVKNIQKTYGAKTILTDINIEFPQHQLTSLIGPNGAGKSTLLMIMARLLEADCGEIYLDQHNIAQIKTAAYAQKVATLRQTPGFNLRITVEELVAFGRFPYSRGVLTVEDHRIIDEAIQFLSLESLRCAYLDEISGGQRQMAFLAMTIAQQTEILLLDEPLNNLDMKHAVLIMRALRRLCDEQGRTVIVVIHDINFASNYSDHIVALKKGQVHFDGPTQQVITAAQLNQLYELDFEITYSERGCMCNYFNRSEI
ncbi:ABC transporter ATP-binding protein [Acinetobacter sp. MD2]|uniref:iron ABC transporter ATP-binding protein n=1 Tax=Acinetobacter sp. MD2 TaxID=2600066 RepID=UPI002D1F3E26|nr:ATP-binding cassette domain-containing protein [Acinetobacter sp. MD2]MEB3766353.1 ATP-binding cassette domain-containing protein [Acinetobacter sp. MD2]